MRVRNYKHEDQIVDAVEEARDCIIACWEDWQAQADEDAQQEQRNEAWFEFMNAQLDCVLYGMLDHIDKLPA